MSSIEYVKIREIFEQMPEAVIHPARGGKFRFPVYMTERMENTDLEVLELSVRSMNCLKRAGIHTIGNLCSRVSSNTELKSIRNCGDRSCAEIMEHLFAYQYNSLSSERKQKYLQKVIEMNKKF